MRRALVLVAALPLVLLLAGCPSAGTPTDPGPPPFFTNGSYTVSGTITSNNMSLASSASVSLISNGKTISKDVAVPAPDGTGAQVVAYSFPGVENITVDVTLTATSSIWTSPNTVGCFFTDDGNQVTVTPSGGATKVFTLPSITIAKSTTIDMQLCPPVFTGGTNTVSGTITSNNMSLASSASVSLISNGKTISKNVTVPPPDGAGAQVVAYSFSGVENITADVTLTATSSIWNSNNVGCNFTQDGGSPVTATTSGGATKVFTFPGANIAKPTAIDVQIFPPDFTNGPNTVSGTLSSYNMDLAPDATIALTCNGITVTQHVTFPAPDITGAQIVTYSFSGVQDITADVMLTATSQNTWDYGKILQFSFSQSGSGPATMTGTNTKVFTLPGVSITQPNTTINVTLNQPIVGGK